MHYIYEGINTNKILELNPSKPTKCSCIYTNSTANMSYIISYDIYQSAYKEDIKSPIDISNEMLNKAISIMQLTNDFKLVLKSLIKE